MKIINKLLDNRDRILQNMNKIKKIIFILATFALFAIFPHKTKVYNKDSGYEYITDLDHVYYDLDAEKLFTDVNGDLVFESQNAKSPCETIVIYGEKNDLFFFVRLAASIKRMFCQRKNVIIILGDGYYKSTIYTYFCEIKLNYGDTTMVENNFFRHLSPNSDFFFITSYFFPSRIRFNLSDILFHNFNNKSINKVNITIQKDMNSTKRFLTYLRALFNMDSHLFGTYFYFTYDKYFIQAEYFLPFIFFNALYYFIDILYGLDFNMSLWPLIYLLSPVFSIFFLNEANIHLSACIFFFFIVNFKMGFLFALLTYFKIVWHVYFDGH